MKTLVIAATLAASMFAIAGTSQAAPNTFDGAKFWQEHESRSY